MKKLFFKYVALNVLGALGLSGYILADTYFVANRLGADGLAALNLALPIFSVINGLAVMLGIGGATRYAICRYQGDQERADRAFSRAFVFGGGVGLLLLLMGLLLAGPIASLLGAEGTTLPMCTVYLRTVLLFAPCFILNQVLIAFVRNDGEPRLSMAAMLIGSLANIVLDYVFLYPLDMGIFGAALATGVAPVIGMCISSLHVIRGKNSFRLRPFRLRLRPLADLAGLGSAAFVNECATGIVLVVFNLLALRLAGTLGVAAYGIVANLAIMAVAVFTGIAQGVQPLISRCYSRDEADEVRLLSRMALLLAGSLGAGLMLLAFFCAPQLVALFDRDGIALLRQMAEQGLRIYFVGFLFAGPNIVAAALLAAAEQARPSFFVSMLRGCVGIVPAALALALLLGLTGLWLAFPVAEAVTFLLALWYVRKLLTR